MEVILIINYFVLQTKKTEELELEATVITSNPIVQKTRQIIHLKLANQS